MADMNHPDNHDHDHSLDLVRGRDRDHEDTLLYVYTVVEASAREALPDLPAPLGGGLRLVEHARLAAVVEPVEAVRFDEEPLRAQLEDLDRLSALARAHHSVVAAVGERTTTVPLQLATLCRGEESVRRLLDEAHQQITATMERIAGAQEWGVKVYVDASSSPPESAPGPAPAPAPGRPPDGSGDGSAGRDYLRRRLKDRRARETAEEEAARTCESIHRVLSAHASAAVLHPPQQPQLSGAPGRNVLNAAYLVPVHARRSFSEAVPSAQMLPRGLRLEVTGPWVPYSFTAGGQGGASS
ncbi:GvpL/GvpF family gas vesicle protein [Streptomyces sp. NPDC044571]|uniref:GvpL/GvpF family gas vesicle protein n=1 Tax=Streptomyces sp. NPDC044571 TaxID=3155371 RepID=UPI0033FEEABB